MRRIFAGALCAVTFASAADATPIYFEFTGIVSQASATTPVGTAVSGSFNLETDRLVSFGQPGIQYSFIDYQPTGLTEPLAILDVGGIHHEVPGYSQNYAGVNFVDGCQPLCNTGWSENFNLGAYTQEPWSAGYTGQLRNSSISLFNLYEQLLPDYPYFQGYDAFDGATAVPLDVLSLPLAHLQGDYYEAISDCIDGTCSTVSSSYFVFEIDTLSRGVKSAESVPEPGTLELLGVAGFSLFLFGRRRRATEPSPREQQA